MKRALFILLASVTVLFSLAVYQHFRYFDGKLHVTFCNVGQGDGIYIKTPSGQDILIDGGPNSDILRCLEDRMRFIDRDVDIVFLTHPHLDHYGGLESVVQRYRLGHFVTENIPNKNTIFEQFSYQLDIHKVAKKYVKKGDMVKVGDKGEEVTITVLWPSEDFLEFHQREINPDLNEGSLVLLLSYGDMDVLLTGDSDVEMLSSALEGHDLPSIEVLKVPHHGSRFGLSPELVKAIDPKLSVISSGKNKYGHPAKDTLKLLEGRKVLRTDTSGSVEIISNGTSWEVKTGR